MGRKECGHRLLPDTPDRAGDRGLFPERDDDIPRDRWVCVQLAITVDPSVGVVKLSLDGSNHMTASTDTLVGVDGYSAVDFGVHYATPAQGPVVLWVDDVVIDTVPVGCN